MSFGRLCRKKGRSLRAERGGTVGMLGAGSAESLRGRLCHWAFERRPDRAGRDHHRSANAPPSPLLVKLWLALLWKHPGEGLTQASAYRQTRALSLARRLQRRCHTKICVMVYSRITWKAC